MITPRVKVTTLNILTILKFFKPEYLKILISLFFKKNL